MSGIYIADMKVPDCCFHCPPDLATAVKCVRTRRFVPTWEHHTIQDGRHPDCPLVAVPDHERLVDAAYVRDAIIQHWASNNSDSYMYKRGMEDANECLRKAPTIIPADKGEI